MVEKILNNTTPYGKIRASREGSLHSSTLSEIVLIIRHTMWYSAIENISYTMYIPVVSQPLSHNLLV